MRLRTTLLLLVTLFTAVSRADPRDAINWVRVRECGARGVLEESPKLREAARSVAAGMSLHAALSSAGYLAERSAAVHLSGVSSDAQLGRLAAGDCGVLADSKLAQMGVHRRGPDVWIVLASPVSLPSPRDAAAIRAAILDLVNRARRDGRRCGARAYAAAHPLALSTVLNDAALAHSQEMAVHDEFDHRGHDGSSPSSRVERAGYGRYLIVGENIAAGAMSPAEVTQGWLDSPAHCENIMDPRFAEIGIAFAVNPSSPELVYWTQDFATPR